MINCLGQELEYAVEELEKEGFSVETVEVRSKKGVDGDSYRVIKQSLIGDESVRLYFSCFKCKAGNDDEQI